jgi:ABC-type uncharacterized transport system permease subunit
VAMALGGMVVGGLWILVAGALRHYRGVNETISKWVAKSSVTATMSH